MFINIYLVIFQVLKLTTILIVAVNARDSVEVVNYYYNHLPNGEYEFSYELSDGQFRSEKGSFSDLGVLSIKGDYRYVKDNGETHSVRYISDEKGTGPTTNLI